MSVGSITNGLNSLLGRLSRTGPAEQGPGARPPVDPVGGLPARPSFQQRYQQDTFESGPGRQGRGGRGGGLDLSGRGHGGGAPGSDAQAQSQSQRQPQQPQARANQADAARDSGGSPRARPADVTEFPKGQPPRQRVKQEPRDNDEQQRRRLQAERARQQQEDGQRQPEDKDRKPAPKQQKPSGGGGGPAPKLKLGSAFKLKNVNGKMEMVKQTFSERKAEAPQGSQDDGGSAKMMAALSQKM